MVQSLGAPAFQTVQVFNGKPASGVNFGNVDQAAGANQAYVIGLFASVLDRGPDGSGLAAWTAQLAGGVSRGAVATAFWQSDEHRSLEVTSYFETYLGRAPDAGGLQSWIGQFQTGAGEIAVQQGIIASEEFQAAHSSAAAYVQALYNDILGRQPGTSEVSLWVGAMSAGMSRANVATAILTSRESFLGILDGLYSQILHRGADNDGATAWLTALQQGQRTITQVAEAFLTSPEFSTWTARQFGV
jgi:hypothetical protein